MKAWSGLPLSSTATPSLTVTRILHVSGQSSGHTEWVMVVSLGSEDMKNPGFSVTFIEYYNLTRSLLGIEISILRVLEVSFGDAFAIVFSHRQD